jgi:hypothetical protein
MKGGEEKQNKDEPMSILVIRFQAVNRSIRMSDGLSSEAWVFFMICISHQSKYASRLDQHTRLAKGRRERRREKRRKGKGQRTSDLFLETVDPAL